jgi:ribonuclease BN (tRNA processing enzyme)
MEIRVLGCYGGELPGCRTTCFLINGRTAIDAGAVTGALSLEEQEKIDSIILTHSHIDHVRDIGFLADNIFGRKDRPVKIYGLAETINSLREHILNFSVWPDFSVLPTPDDPVISYSELVEEENGEVEDLTIMPVKVNHTVPTAGLIVTNEKSSVLFTSDTGPTERIWEKAKEIEELAGVFIEISFPDRLKDLAKATGHLTPSMAADELAKLDRPDVQVFAYHMKPQYVEEIVKQVTDEKIDLKVLSQEDTLNF